MNLLVMFGGCSSEYEVSLQSAASVLRNIPEKYNVIKLGITKDGRWFFYDGDTESVEDGSWCEKNVTPAVLSPDRADKALIVLKDGKYEKIHIDVVFPVLHGKNGEDGTVQGIFELAGIPQAKWAAFSEYEYKNGRVDLSSIIKKLSFPIFVKPANAGSSVGITKAGNEEELKKALELAFLNDKKAVLEETVVGRELECAVMGNDEPVASCVGEILPEAEFYDYDAKYIDGTTKLAIPAPLTKEEEEKIRTTAIKAYRTMGCTGLSRVDFFMKPDGTVCINELNTLPGFTSISMYSKLFMESGISYSEIVDRLIGFALERK